VEEDRLLMARLANGQHAAIGDLYDQYGHQVYSLARRMLQESAAAEDITQEVFLKVWRNAARFDPERGAVGTWILHITYTSTVDLLRQRQRASAAHYEVATDEPDPEADTESDAVSILLGDQVRTALIRLPGEQRQALEMAYFGALTQQEIANRLNIPLGTVKSRVRLGLQALRQFLALSRRKEGDHAHLSPQR
jgi:RNA polymerase sigma factor (sigma-70 family)